MYVLLENVDVDSERLYETAWHMFTTPNSSHAKRNFPFILHLILDTTPKIRSKTIVLFPMHLTCLAMNGIYMRDARHS